MRTIFLLLTLFLFGCNNLQHKNNIQSPQKTEGKENATLSKVFEFPIKTGSYLQTTDSANGEYPEDFQLVGNKLYILSGSDRRLLSYDILSSQFDVHDKIQQKLLQEKEDISNVISAPEFVRITNNYIVFGYGFKILVFSTNETFIYKLSFKTALQYLSVENNDKISLWCHDIVTIINLNDTNDKKTLQNTNDHLVDLIVGSGKTVASRSTVLQNNGTSIDSGAIVYPSSKILPTVNADNYSLNCITTSYFVWFPWTFGSKVVLINRNDHSEKVIDLGFDISKGALSYMEDRSEGLRVTGDDKTLYFMVMVKDGNNKLIRVYKLDLP